MKPSRTKKPIQFFAATLPWKQLPDYPDIGSWKVNADNSPAVISCADTGDDVSNCGILIHEIVESVLCWVHGVKEEDVSSFDQQWFKEQKEGKHHEDDEPGYSTEAPYHLWHLVAERVERCFIENAGMMWSHHVSNCEGVYKDA